VAAQAEDIKRLKERVEGHSGPVLSIYLSVNARYPDNQGQAYKVRLKDALREMEDLPEELDQQVRESVEGEVRQHSRTVVFFAAQDGLFERYDLQLDLPEAYRFGEPYLAPLILALDKHESYGVALVDAEEFRFFVSAPMGDPSGGSGGASSGYFREVDLKPSRPYPRGGGQTDLDPAGRKQQSNINRFYKDVGELTQKLVNQDNVKNLIIAGPKERTSDFLKALPEPLKERIVAEERVATNAPEAEIMQQFETIQQQSEREREDDLIAKVRENGVHGVKDTIEALQEGRVYHLVALYDLEGETRWCDNDELAITDMMQKECPFCRQETRVRPVMDVLIDLATNRGARLEYVRSRDDFGQTPNEDIEREHNRGDASAVLHEEFEGLAGLLRY
jgi:Bacterial archaeo-eukaryotic release factor family 10